MMNAAAPDGTPPWRINEGNVLKLPSPAVPEERPRGKGTIALSGIFIVLE